MKSRCFIRSSRALLLVGWFLFLSQGTFTEGPKASRCQGGSCISYNDPWGIQVEIKTEYLGMFAEKDACVAAVGAWNVALWPNGMAYCVEAATDKVRD